MLCRHYVGHHFCCLSVVHVLGHPWQANVFRSRPSRVFFIMLTSTFKSLSLRSMIKLPKLRVPDQVACMPHTTQECFSSLRYSVYQPKIPMLTITDMQLCFRSVWMLRLCLQSRMSLAPHLFISVYYKRFKLLLLSVVRALMKIAQKCKRWVRCMCKP